jgi:hypothetical protein
MLFMTWASVGKLLELQTLDHQREVETTITHMQQMFDRKLIELSKDPDAMKRAVEKAKSR